MMCLTRPAHHLLISKGSISADVTNAKMTCLHAHVVIDPNQFAFTAGGRDLLSSRCCFHQAGRADHAAAPSV